MSTPPRVQPLHDGQFLVVHDDGWQQLAFAVVDGRTTWVFLDGHVYQVTPDAPVTTPTAQASTADDAAALSAPMPATVSAVHVATGQQVSPGDLLVTLEAMKMELPIRSPRASVVTAVNCTAGEMVQPGVPLVTLE